MIREIELEEIILNNLPALIVVIPILMAAVLACFPARDLDEKRSDFAWWFVLIALIATLCASLLNAKVTEGTSASYAFGGWPPPWGIEFVTDGASRLMCILISAISLVTTFHAKTLIRREINPFLIPKTYAAWLLTIGSLLGLVMTADAFNLFVFLEISSLSAVTLVAMGAGIDRRALVGAFNYLIIGAIGATFYVIGVGFLYAMTGTLNMADLAAFLPRTASTPIFVGLAFMVAGIMVKAAAFPVHFWLPAAYGYAPSAVSSLLAAIATKAALYVLIRLLLTVFAGLPELTILILTWVIIPLSLIAMFSGTILAIYEKDVKKMLAQSSVAQIGYITLGLGFGTAAGVTASFIHIVNHAMIKGGMFMAVGAFAVQLGRRASIDSIVGLGRAMPITSAGFLVCGLSLIGLPLTAGFISKLYLVRASVDFEYNTLTALIVISSALSLVYLWKLIEAMWMHPAPKDSTVKDEFWVYTPLWLLALANVYFGIKADIVISLSTKAMLSVFGGGS